PGRSAAEAGAGRLAEPGAVALRAARRQEAADSPHVRAGRAEGGWPQAHPGRARGARQSAGRPVALPRSARTLLKHARRGPDAPRSTVWSASAQLAARRLKVARGAQLRVLREARVAVHGNAWSAA